MERISSASGRTRGLVRVILVGLMASAAFAHRLQAQDLPQPVAQSDPATNAKPLWELGIAGGAGVLTQYPASDVYQIHFLPLPYFIYRGGFFRSDDAGARVRARLRSNVQLEFSGEASFETHSSGSGARAGMPKLDYLFGAGPDLRITLFRPAPQQRIVLDLPVRLVVSMDRLDFAYQGLTFTPHLTDENRHLFGSPWSSHIALGSEFANQRFQGYFYQVDPQYVRPGRPAYDARGGYLGSYLDAGVARNLTQRVRMFVFARSDFYAGAANQSSPLFKSTVSLSGFIGFSWSIRQSRQVGSDS